MKRIKNYINGKLIEPSTGKYIDNHNPATGQVYSHIPDSDEHDVDMAIQAAKDAFSSWASLTANQRADWLEKIANRISERQEELALAESIDNGIR